MPFIGRDWRSPGEAWVKTESLGWQRMKIIESQLHPNCHSSNHPACSWPPRAQFGQHMANNCSNLVGGTTDNEPTVDQEVGNDINNIRRTGAVRGQVHCMSDGSSCSSSSSSSTTSSTTSSTATSPTSSPEKNNTTTMSMHHLHPITISSPYGRYSCCAHQLGNESPCGSPRSSTTTANQHFLSSARKLDELNPDESNGLSHASSLTPDSPNSGSCPRLRYNNSCSDFRSSQERNWLESFGRPSMSSAGQTSHRANKTDDNISSSCELNNPTTGDYPSSPILIKRNDTEIMDDNHPRDNHHELDMDSRRSVSPTNLSNNCYMACNGCGGANVGQQCPLNYKDNSQPKQAPHCRISVRTREVAMYNTISEAFYRLDFCNAIHDIRRFNYICKLLHLLITQNLTSLSGCATKVLFTMLEQVAWEVSSNKRNIHVLRNLLDDLKLMIQKYYCWGRPIGSSLLWQQHFDTIERISQIVDDIELSPPKEECDRVTFDKLPVEMVREILLRLNDYRDLVNSAQASPVMRTMIDSQYIWQQLCRYHFTDQQLKSALESHELYLAKRNSTLCGVKYARTSSADGSSSYRSPVAHKQHQPPSSSSSSSSPSSSSSSSSCDRIEQQAVGQTSSARNHSSTGGGSSPSSSSSSSSPSSHVTNTIRIFNRDGCSSTNDGELNRNLSSGHDLGSQTQSRQMKGHTVANRGQESSANSTSPRIDWEHIFHQLRKRYDLKEEYADCLLLCRHCRCLFWKSFGHPCIKGDDSPVGDGCLRQTSGGQSNRTQSLERTPNSSNSRILGDNSNNTSESSSYSANDANLHPHRPSVASLSRNFDNRANPSGGSLPPIAPNDSRTLSGRRNSGLASQQPRQPLGNLSAQLNARGNVNRNNNNNANNRGRDPNGTRGGSPNELVPKHVTITPQAFLKFFSL